MTDQPFADEAVISVWFFRRDGTPVLMLLSTYWGTELNWDEGLQALTIGMPPEEIRSGKRPQQLTSWEIK